MAKTKSSLTNMVVVLVGFALAIAALLAWVNHVTEGSHRGQGRENTGRRHQESDGRR